MDKKEIWLYRKILLDYQCEFHQIAKAKIGYIPVPKIASNPLKMLFGTSG
jgi:hypothetical protein